MRRVLFVLIAVPTIASAQSGTCNTHLPQFLGAQATVIGQRLSPFSSPYTGPMSFTATGDRQVSESYGVYAGVCVVTGLDLYVDAEMIRGAGISHASGLAGVTNGDVIRQGSADLGDGPYIARAFLRWSHALGGGGLDTIGRAMDDRPRVVASHRVEIAAGKFGLSDGFDVNRYANSTRLQFLNWGLFQNTAWDYAADTRGYSNGVSVAWITPEFTVRAGTFQMPTFANGNIFDSHVAVARGDNIELTVRAAHGAVLRFLAYENHARMGRYAVALAANPTMPDIVADDAPGRTKYGFGFNGELPLADHGETGLFARAGWSDGKNESFAFTESDGHLSIGLQLAGARWRRSDDRVGLAIVANGLSSDHRAYLAAGGSGFLLGDGKLRYGSEMITELYYRIQLGPYIQLTPDVEWIINPGYNRDRGPAVVSTIRFRAGY
jgi:high affinity Mn2+ porin